MREKINGVARTEKLRYFLMMLACTLLPFMMKAQHDAEWFRGVWPGTHHNPISLHKDFVSSMDITKISKNTFEAIFESHLASDTTVRIISRARGRIYNSYMKFVSEKVLYAKHPANQKWETQCNECDSARLDFKIDADRFVITATNKCDARALCQGTAYFSRPMAQLVKIDKGSMRRYVASSADGALQEGFRRYQVESTVAEKEVVVTPVTREKGSDEIKLVPIAPAKRGEVAEELVTSYQGREVEVQQTIYTGSDSVDLILYDNGVVDDDTVSIIYNGRVVVDKIRLTESPQLKRIGVRRDKKNQLIMFAENLGKIPPNTALLRIYNATNEVSVYASSDYNKSYSLIFENNSPKSKPGVAAELFICYYSRSY
ncbi:MAG: hypothetical protein ABW036_01780 [Flavitalea sp.]